MSGLHDRLRARANVKPVRRYFTDHDLEAIRTGVGAALFMMALGAMCAFLFAAFEAMDYRAAGEAFCASGPPASLYTLETYEGPAHFVLQTHVAFEAQERAELCPPRSPA